MRPINLARNFGKEAALAAGLASAGGQAVLFIDADLQHPPELIPRMMEHWRNGFDVINAVKRLSVQ
ncbi:MAG: glycosyltransferase [Chromatiales bacterium]|nr:glycosyltransferase [Chromatiales bacterium]